MKQKRSERRVKYRWDRIISAFIILIVLAAGGYYFFISNSEVNNDIEAETASKEVAVQEEEPVKIDVKDAAIPEMEMSDINGVMVLNYHKVEDKHLSLSVRVEDFDKHMMWLKDGGYTSITPEQLYDFIANGGELPPKPVLITFDDGYLDNYTNAYPILRKYGFIATIFVVTSFLDRYDNYMTWEQAKELSDRGFSIESHTNSHKSMTNTSDEELNQELLESRQMIKEKIGKEAFFIAYPTGTYSLYTANIIKEAGYKGAFTIKYDNVSKNSNVYALERVPIFQTENTNHDFLERIRYMPIFRKYGWVKN